MPIERLVVVADAHLGAVPPAVEEALLRFLDAVPTLGDGLLLNGDLFGFWFGFRRALPRAGIRVAARLAALARAIPVLMTGGNHDRWGASVWEHDFGIQFSARELRFDLGQGTVLALHGDGLAEPTRWLALKQRIVSSPIISAGYRVLPADLGFRLAGSMGGGQERTERSDHLEAQAAMLQRTWAEQRLRDEAPGTLLILGHTHRAAAEELFPGRRYLNPGAWLDGYRYAIATGTALTLKQFPG
jgi:UDP-2,3-diacylglucosamine hydrolase